MKSEEQAMERFLFFTVILLIALAFAAATVLLGGKRVRKGIYKYIPSIVAGAAAIALVIKTAWFSEGFEGLGYLIMAMIAAVIFFVSIITAILMEIVRRKGKGGNGGQNQ
jgi:hypothetical protein